LSGLAGAGPFFQNPQNISFPLEKVLLATNLNKAITMP
jgi:hypothetical protein